MEKQAFGVSSKAIIDYKLTRYACYLIVQNANQKFEAVGQGQTYFAVQTRKMELTEDKKELKILIDLQMPDIKDFIMAKQLMI